MGKGTDGKPTPGPWIVEEDSDVWGMYEVKDPLFLGESWEEKEARNKANARLISSAPELLESLKEIVALTDRTTDIWDKAHAAIDKAEGR